MRAVTEIWSTEREDEKSEVWYPIKRRTLSTSESEMGRIDWSEWLSLRERVRMRVPVGAERHELVMNDSDRLVLASSEMMKRVMIKMRVEIPRMPDASSEKTRRRMAANTATP
jgi:hypothetical protein